MSYPPQVDLTQKELSVMKAVRNSIIHKGSSPSIRELMRMLGYKSTYSVVLILNKLIEAGYLGKKDGVILLLKDLAYGNTHAQTVDIPLIGNIACGTPSLAMREIEAMIPVSTSLAKPTHKYFLLRATGDSMNQKNINAGDLVLVRQQNTAENGDLVVALIDDNATIKEFERRDDIVLLRPRSKNKEHKPIILTSDFIIQGKVISTIKNF